MISIIVNTCARAAQRERYPVPVNGPYDQREQWLREITLPRYLADPLVTDVILVASCDDWPGLPPVVRLLVLPDPKPLSPIACLDKRHLGAQAARNDIVVFHHDDMVLADDAAERIAERDSSLWDVLAMRLRRRGDPNEYIEDGWPAYIMGHGICMHRRALDKVPWNTVPRRMDWDVQQSKLLSDMRMRIVRADNVVLEAI